ncbi:MAG: hypothetical protein H7Y60_01030 [Rhodospirillaceae bacterium]|nr:hypothetical protein [Rhodospirillales bacterium]
MDAQLDEIMRQASAAAGNSRWEEAASLYMKAVGAQPKHRPAWHGLVLALAMNRQLPLLRGLVDFWQKLGGERFTLVQDIFTILLTYGLHDSILELAATYPAQGTEEVLVVYAAACVHVLRDEEDAAFALLVRFKALVEQYREQLPIHPGDPFNVAYRQGTLVEDLPYVAALMAGPPPELPQVQLYRPLRFNDAQQVAVASCNGLYFDLFAEAYCHAIDATTQDALIHIHVMEPEAGTLSRIERLMDGMKNSVLNVSWETQQPNSSRSYFASNRFLIAPQLLDLYGRDLVISDIDIEFVTDLAELHAKLAGQDFACYAHPGFGPASRYPAGVTYLSHAHGRDIADGIARFVCSKLHIPHPHNWMLDQAALISVQRWLRSTRPDVALGRMNDLLGPRDTVFRLHRQDEAAKDAAILSAISKLLPEG